MLDKKWLPRLVRWGIRMGCLRIGAFLAIGECFSVLGKKEMSRADPGKLTCDWSPPRPDAEATLKFMADWKGRDTELLRWPMKGFDAVFISGSFNCFSLFKLTKVAPPNCFLEVAEMLKLRLLLSLCSLRS